MEIKIFSSSPTTCPRGLSILQNHPVGDDLGLLKHRWGFRLVPLVNDNVWYPSIIKVLFKIVFCIIETKDISEGASKYVLNNVALSLEEGYRCNYFGHSLRFLWVPLRILLGAQKYIKYTIKSKLRRRLTFYKSLCTIISISSIFTVSGQL